MLSFGVVALSMDLTQELKTVNDKIDRKQDEILAIRKQLRRTPDDSDLQVDLESFQEQLERLEAYRREILQTIASMQTPAQASAQRTQTTGMDVDSNGIQAKNSRRGWRPIANSPHNKTSRLAV